MTLYQDGLKLAGQFGFHNSRAADAFALFYQDVFAPFPCQHLKCEAAGPFRQVLFFPCTFRSDGASRVFIELAQGQVHHFLWWMRQLPKPHQFSQIAEVLCAQASQTPYHQVVAIRKMTGFRVLLQESPLVSLAPSIEWRDFLLENFQLMESQVLQFFRQHISHFHENTWKNGLENFVSGLNAQAVSAARKAGNLTTESFNYFWSGGQHVGYLRRQAVSELPLMAPMLANQRPNVATRVVQLMVDKGEPLVEALSREWGVPAETIAHLRNIDIPGIRLDSAEKLGEMVRWLALLHPAKRPRRAEDWYALIHG